MNKRQKEKVGGILKQKITCQIYFQDSCLRKHNYRSASGKIYGFIALGGARGQAFFPPK